MSAIASRMITSVIWTEPSGSLRRPIKPSPPDARKSLVTSLYGALSFERLAADADLATSSLPALQRAFARQAAPRQDAAAALQVRRHQPAEVRALDVDDREPVVERHRLEQLAVRRARRRADRRADHRRWSPRPTRRDAPPASGRRTDCLPPTRRRTTWSPSTRGSRRASPCAGCPRARAPRRRSSAPQDRRTPTCPRSRRACSRRPASGCHRSRPRTPDAASGSASR